MIDDLKRRFRQKTLFLAEDTVLRNSFYLIRQDFQLRRPYEKEWPFAPSHFSDPRRGLCSLDNQVDEKSYDDLKELGISGERRGSCP